LFIHSNSLDEIINVSNEVIVVLVDSAPKSSTQCYLYNAYAQKRAA